MIRVDRCCFILQRKQSRGLLIPALIQLKNMLRLPLRGYFRDFRRCAVLTQFDHLALAFRSYMLLVLYCSQHWATIHQTNKYGNLKLSKIKQLETQQIHLCFFLTALKFSQYFKQHTYTKHTKQKHFDIYYIQI